MEVLNRLTSIWSPAYAVMVFIASITLLTTDKPASVVIAAFAAVVGVVVLIIRSAMVSFARSLPTPERV